MITIATEIFHSAFDTGLLTEHLLQLRRIQNLKKYFQEQYAFFSPFHSEVIPFFGERRTHLTCRKETIFFRPSFKDAVYTVFFLEFVSNLCGEDIVIVRSEANQIWVDLLEKNPSFKRKFNFSDRINPALDRDKIFLLDQVTGDETILKNSYFETLNRIIIEDREVFEKEKSVLATIFSDQVVLTDDISQCSRNSVVFGKGVSSVPDVKYLFLQTTPIDIFIENPELMPPLFEGFSVRMLFNDVIVTDKVYSLKDSKQSYLDYMPASRFRPRNYFSKINQEVNEKEVEALFLKKLKE